MFASPFGEKFHFRTALSLDECQRRIDALEASPFGETNFSKQPVSSRRKSRFTLWENAFGQPPRLTGNLFSNKGWTEISGRAGANFLSFWSAVGFLLLVPALSAFNAIFEGGWIGIIQVVAVALLGSAYMYWRSWEDPHAGHLIDQLQSMLEAEPLPTTLARSAIR